MSAPEKIYIDPSVALDVYSKREDEMEVEYIRADVANPASDQSAEIDLLRNGNNELNQEIEKMSAEIERLKARLNATHVTAEKRLTDFFLWFRANGEKYVDKNIEAMIEIYLTH